MRKPPCKKCGSRSTYIESPPEGRIIREAETLMGCVTCGWRLYGSKEVQEYIYAYNEKQILADEQDRLAREAEASRLEAERIERERLLREAEASRREEERLRLAQQVRIDPDLLLPIAVILGIRKCGWPPCENEATENSKYCSRTCTVRVAHRREKLRKAQRKAAS